VHFLGPVSEDDHEVSEERGRRLLIVQIDGLAAARLRAAMATGTMPHLRAYLDRTGVQLHARRSAVPPSTPVFQSALLYGRHALVHGYSWFDRASGRVCRMDVPADVADVEERLAAGCSRGPLLARGDSASYFLTFLGGAARAFLTLANGMLPSGRWRTQRMVLAVLRALGRAPAEAAAAAADLLRFVSLHRTTQFEWNWLAMRVLHATVFEEAMMTNAALDLAQGSPIVYVNFVAYDEAAHRRGPEHAVCRAQLARIDARLPRLLEAAERHGYEVVLCSDHGQAAAIPFARVTGRTLAATVFATTTDRPGTDGAAFAALVDRLDGARVRASRVRKWPDPVGRLVSARAQVNARRAALRLARRWDVPAGEIAVVTGGSVAHVYVGRAPGGATIEAIQARFPRLVPALLASPGIGLVVAPRTAEGAVVFHGGRRVRLDDPAALAELFPFRQVGAETLAGLIRRVIAVETAGDLVLYGAFAAGGAVSFEPELGSHGGVHPDELDLFVAPPAELPLPEGANLDPAELGLLLRLRYAA
jgi:hypothetical protein